MNDLLFHRHGGVDDSPGLLDFSVSISPLFPFGQLPGIGKESMQVYPSIDGRGIKELYSRKFGLEQESVLALNGAIEGIYLLPRAIPMRRMLLFSPSFYDYARAARLAGVETASICLDAGNAFMMPSFSEIADAVSECDAFLAGNPNNPTGTLFSPEFIMALASRFPDKWFFVDEAFLQFVPGFEELTLMRHVGAFRNIVVIHSLTKYYALPGLRLGALVAHPDTIVKLYEHKEPWTVNAIAESVAPLLLECGGYDDDLRVLICSERKRITASLLQIGGIELVGGAANFFLARWIGHGSFDALLSCLADSGIYVRDCRNFAGLEENYFRFAVRKPFENTRLIDALRTASGSL